MASFDGLSVFRPRQALDGLYFPGTNTLANLLKMGTASIESVITGGANATGTAGRASKAVRDAMDALKTRHVAMTSDIASYHQMFTQLFEASEEMRRHQARAFHEKVEHIIDVKDRELQDYKDTHHDAAYVAPAAVIEFQPADVLPVSEEIDDYIAESIATGVPLTQLLPPTLLAAFLKPCATSSDSDTCSSGGWSTTTGEAGSTTTGWTSSSSDCA